jgi:hypothetical protein
MFYVERKPDGETHVKYFYFLKASISEYIGRAKEGEDFFLYTTAIRISVSVRCVAIMSQYRNLIRNGS